MKNLFGILLIVAVLTSCKKNRTSGICYCTFVKGDDQQYDLRDSTREVQIEQCNISNNNANKFGGKCELE